MSDYFRNARDLTITSASFSHVGRDQHNHHWTTQVIHKETKERTIFDNIHNVKSSAIYRIRDVHEDRYENRHRWNRGRNVDKMICLAEVDRGGRVGTVCTVVSYTGPDAREEFLEEYRKRSRFAVSSRAAQIYAVDVGNVPSVIYRNELVPAVVFQRNLGFLGKTYLYALRMQWPCPEEELWMDAARGVICRGPEGPYPGVYPWHVELGDVPSTVDLLQDKVFARFLANRKSKEVDRQFVEVISRSSVMETSEVCHQPIVISISTQTPIAVANNIWEDGHGSLLDRKLLENGVTRFRLHASRTSLGLRWNNFAEESWVSQASSVFHTLGIKDTLGDLRLVWRWARLYGHLSENQLKRRLEQPIYLFVLPPPPNVSDGDTSSLHYWSFEEDGQSSLFPEICNQLGLPTELRLWDYGYKSHSWPTNVYECLHEYQLLRGFNDLTTTDFARHVGYDEHIFQPADDANRFEEVNEGVLNAFSYPSCTDSREEQKSCRSQSSSNFDIAVGIDSDSGGRTFPGTRPRGRTGLLTSSNNMRCPMGEEIEFDTSLLYRSTIINPKPESLCLWLPPSGGSNPSLINPGANLFEYASSSPLSQPDAYTTSQGTSFIPYGFPIHKTLGEIPLSSALAQGPTDEMDGHSNSGYPSGSTSHGVNNSTWAALESKASALSNVAEYAAPNISETLIDIPKRLNNTCTKSVKTAEQAGLRCGDLGSRQPEIDELCILFERLSIV